MPVDIAGRLFGRDEPPLLIAEAGVNHNGSLEMALRLVEAAAAAGADVVKFQTFSAEAVVLASAPQAAYQQERAAAGSQLDMVRPLELALDAWRGIQEHARAHDILFLSTPFDLGSVHLLAGLGVPAFKIGSGDVTNLILLRAVAAQGLPVLLSTGMATMPEIEAAVADLRAHGNPPLVLLQCTSAYPADPADANLRAMDTMRRRFGVPIGYSDHTLGIGVAVAAAALGAVVIEKHLTLDRSLPGPDQAASLEPAELGALVAAVHAAHDALGDGVKVPRPSEDDIRRVARRSLVATRAIKAGSVLEATDLDARRPEGGVSPLRLDDVIGRVAARDLPADSVIRAEDVTPPLPTD